MLAQLSRASSEIDWKTAGFIGTISKYIPGTPAADLKATLLTLRANIGFKQIALMKEQSSTGATGLGQVAVPEFEALQGAMGNLEQSQSPKQLRSQIAVLERAWNKYRAAVIRTETRARAAFKRRGKRAPASAPPAGAVLPEGMSDDEYNARKKALGL